jgi:hypothetical protein
LTTVPELAVPGVSGRTAEEFELPLDDEESAADGVGDTVGVGAVEGDVGVRTTGDGEVAVGPVLGLGDAPDGTVTEVLEVDGGEAGAGAVEEVGVEDATAGVVDTVELVSGVLRPAELATPRDAETSWLPRRPAARGSVPDKPPECPEPSATSGLSSGLDETGATAAAGADTGSPVAPAGSGSCPDKLPPGC